MGDKPNKCVWMWAGVLNYRLCDRDYQCARCPVDQLFRSPASKEPVSTPRSASMPAGRMVPATDRFHDEQHLWMRVLPEGQVQIGLDPLAARLLESADGFHLPRVGTHLRRGAEAFSAQADGGCVAFASPVSGHVLRVHAIAPGRVRPALSRPYSRAWLLVVGVARLEQQLSHFFFGRAAGFRLRREWRLFQQDCLALAPGAAGGPLALPDGGEIDLDRFRPWTGCGYLGLVGRWVGIGARRRSKGGTDRGSASSDPGTDRASGTEGHEPGPAGTEES